MTTHPRLYFTPEEQLRLRDLRGTGHHALIWNNLRASADWCLTRPLRARWIAPVSPDPIYENLYDRFYASMHDMGVAEHLAFAYAYSGDDRYFNAARDWLLALCRVWICEADGEPDQNKAYAITRLLKGIATGYDLLHDRLSDADRGEVRTTLLAVGGKYYDWYVANPGMAGPDQEPHHGSVEAASFGVAALALLDEEPAAREWLDLMLEKHTGWLLEHALTPSLTHNQSSNFWISIMQYRLCFMDALRRVTGRDLFTEYARYMDGRMALAGVVGPGSGGLGQTHESILWGYNFNPINYVSPVLLALAREYRRPIYQHLAMWDRSAGSIQQTRYVTRSGERMLFAWGGNAYAWYDPTVPPAIEPDLPRSFLFLDPDPNPILSLDEMYARASYEPGALCAGMKRGLLVVHGGGVPVFADPTPKWPPPAPATNVSLEDDGQVAVMRCVAPAEVGFTEQTVTLHRPSRLTVQRVAQQPLRWWCYRVPTRDGNVLTWDDGTTLRVTRGRILSVDPTGHREELAVGMGKLKVEDPEPWSFPQIVAEPEDGELAFEVVMTSPVARASRPC